MTSKELFLQSTELAEKPGIYLIYCLTNEKCYIGSSVNVKRRERQHRSDLKKKIHHCANLQNAWNKYGKENFIFRFIEETEELTKQFLIDRENTYLIPLGKLQVFNSAIPATLVPENHNTLKGESHHQSKVTGEIAKQIKAEYDSIVKPGKLVLNIRKKLAEKYNLPPKLVGAICGGRHWTNPEYNWKNAGSHSEISVFGKEKQKRGCSEKIKLSKEVCSQIYNDWVELQKELNGRAYIPGGTQKLARKYKVHEETIRSIARGEHPNSPIHETKSVYRIESYAKKLPLELPSQVRKRYEEIRKEAGLEKVPGISSMLMKEFQITKQAVVLCLNRTRVKTREISS